jgi:2-dehydropantoate 2-reductase
MRTLIAGAGAVGGYFGALLLRAGRDVTFLARGPHADAIRAHGLAVDSFREGRFQVQPQVVTTLADAGGPFDLILVTVKWPALPQLAQELGVQRALVGERGAVVPLQNGIGADQVLAGALAPTSIVGGVAHVGAEVTAPGQIRHTTRGEILVAPLPGNPPDRAREVAAFLDQSGVPGGYHDDLGFITWRKLVWNNAFNAVTALSGASMRQAAVHPRLRELLRAAMNEAVAVATAEGVKLPDTLIDFLLGLGEQYGDARTSMHQDVLCGRPTEHDALNGVVCRLGRRHGIATPINDTLYALLDGLDPHARAR